MRVSFGLFSPSAPRGCFAFPLESEIDFAFTVFGAKAKNVWIYVGNDEKVLFGREVPFVALEDGFSVEYKLNASELTGKDGLFFTHFEFEDVNGKRFYSATDENCDFYLSDRFVNEESFLVFNEIYESPEWFAGGVVYQIFPDRFAKGGKAVRKADAKYNDDWDHGTPEYPARAGDAYDNNTHFGGTLWGAAEKLDYLERLGVTCVYFNPVYKAFSNHKYDIGDYLQVDESFGGNEALRYFVKKAHEHGIAVILDGVFNHVGDDSVYFNKYGKYGSVGAYQSKDSPYYEWFRFGQDRDDYESWWGIKNLPRTVRCKSFRDFITKTVIPHYMEMGIDGWRLDVVDELESGFLDEIVQAVKTYKPDALMIGEVWEDASLKEAYGERKRYFRGAELDSVTNYPFRNGVIDFLTGNGAFMLASILNTLYRHYPAEKQKYLLNFLGSHDTERITTVLGGDIDFGFENSDLANRFLPEEEREKAVKLLEEGYKLLAALPGVPCIFYGDEIGMEGYHDPFNRRPFPVAGFDDPMAGSFAGVNALRKKYAPYFLLPELKATVLDENLLLITRTDGKKKLCVYANMGEKDIKLLLSEKSLDIMDQLMYYDSVKIPSRSVILTVSGEEND